MATATHTTASAPLPQANATLAPASAPAAGEATAGALVLRAITRERAASSQAAKPFTQESAARTRDASPFTREHAADSRASGAGARVNASDSRANAADSWATTPFTREYAADSRVNAADSRVNAGVSRAISVRISRDSSAGVVAAASQASRRGFLSHGRRRGVSSQKPPLKRPTIVDEATGMPDFLPSRERELLAWARSFLSKISIDPPAFLLSQQQVDELSDCVDRFAECYARAEAPDTNSSVAIAGKRDAKRRLKQTARAIARIVRAVPGLSEAERVSLGLGVPDDTLTPGSAPAEPPDIAVRSPSQGMLRVRLSVPSSNRRARPRNAVGAMVFLHTGDSPPATPNDWGTPVLTSTPEVTIELSPATPRGAKIWVTACWLGTRLQRSPYARTVSLNVAGGAVPVPGRMRAAA